MSLIPSISRPNAARCGPDPNDKQVIGFEVRLIRAKSVWLLGIVGDWHPSFVKFERHGHGLWVAKIELAPGDYSYRLIVDGSWSDTSAAVSIDASLPSIERFFSVPRAVAAEDGQRKVIGPELPTSDLITPHKSRPVRIQSSDGAPKMKTRKKTKMKRMSALILTAITLAISLPGCASQDDGQQRQSDGHTTHTH